MKMGRKALEVGEASQAASIVFLQLKMDRGISERAIQRGTGIAGKSRVQGLLDGTAVWTLDDVVLFAKFFNISLKVTFKEIEKEIHRLTSEKNFPHPFIEDSRVG